MSAKKKIKEAQNILKALGLPSAQQNELAALTLLALCDLKPNDKWANAKKISKGVAKDIMEFVRKIYKKDYAENSRETFRRKVLHQFVQSSIADYNPDNPNLPVNSPNAHYAISNQALEIIKKYNTPKFAKMAKEFIINKNILYSETIKARNLKSIPVTLGGKDYNLSPGKHNIVQASIVNTFAPLFAPGGEIVYLGDTEKKNLYIDEKLSKSLGIPIDNHNKLPDVIIYRKDKDWLYLIEAVTSHGPVSPKRIIELEELFKKCKSGKIYVSAFPDFAEFRKHTSQIAWETEVWIVETPEHLIHYNGDKFFGPRK
jgi:type II restriction enzyme